RDLTVTGVQTCALPILVLAAHRNVDAYVFKNGVFDYDRFKMVSQNRLGVSVLRFIEIQRRELLADRLREEMKTGVRVSPAEVKEIGRASCRGREDGWWG